MAAGIRRPVTRWTAELTDREQERQYRRYHLPIERRSSLALVTLLLLAALIAPGVYLYLQPDSLDTKMAALELGLAVVGLVLVIVMGRQSTPRGLYRTVELAVVVISGATGALIAFFPGMGFRGALLIVGGVILIYLWAPLTLRGVVVLALIFTACTVPPWLLMSDAEDTVDVRYTVAAVVLAHVAGIVEAHRQQRERRALFSQREALQDLSTADSLTGLMNRRAFDRILQSAWSDWMATQRPLSLLMVDIDHFKQLNDTAGHTAGDKALQDVAMALVRAMPSPRYKTARFGGEEFTCLLPGVTIANAQIVADSVLAEVRRVAIPTPGPNDGGVLTVSVGVATARLGMSEPGELIDLADEQLYRAKRGGRNRALAAP